MLAPLGELLEWDPKRPMIGLSVSAVCHSYCRHRTDCQDSQNIRRILGVLERRLIDSYETRRHDRFTKETVRIIFFKSYHSHSRFVYHSILYYFLDNRCHESALKHRHQYEQTDQHARQDDT